MAVYWIFECLPLPITSLLPLGQYTNPLSPALNLTSLSLAAPLRSCQHGRGLPQ